MITTIDLVLTGGRARRTEKLNGKQFVNGVLRIRGSQDQLVPVIAYYGRVYQAFPYGSQELRDAQERDAVEKAKRHGEHHAHAAPQPGPANGVQRPGADANARELHQGDSAVLREADHGAEAGRSRVLPDRSGHQDAGLRPGQGAEQQQSNAAGDLTRVRNAVTALDGDVAEHWTQDGRPTVEAVAAALNDPSVTRKVIDAAAGDWNREQALAKKALA